MIFPHVAIITFHPFPAMYLTLVYSHFHRLISLTHMLYRICEILIPHSPTIQPLTPLHICYNQTPILPVDDITNQNDTCLYAVKHQLTNVII